MIITKMCLPRRTFLRGMGATLALPLLDAMVPSMTALAATPAAPVRPTLKSAYPLTPMDRYVRWTDEEGLPVDTWMRVHARLGAEVVAIDLDDVRICHLGDLSQLPSRDDVEAMSAVDVLLTNFHLPRSSLLILVSAFAGRDLILNAYNHAAREGYRFYSYGDCMLIL